MRYLPNYVKITNKKIKVLFTCHPNDKKYYELIAQKIISQAPDSVVYIEEDEAVKQDEESWAEIISEMHLIVIPVTKDFLYTNNTAKDFDFEYARKNHIPLLMWITEGGLSEECNKVCGKIQCLNMYDQEGTDLGYLGKLNRHLSYVGGMRPEFAGINEYLKEVIGDDNDIKSEELRNELGNQADNIHNAFSGRIFLSYRKNDRKYALEVMRKIHSLDKFRDWAIWYDEYLHIGERFDDEIERALKECDLFVLLVTPGILEENNYVAEREYPMARENHKIIFSVECVPTDREELLTKYPGIEQVLFDFNDEDFAENFSKTILKTGVETREMTHVRSFQLGIAYLNGIEVERNIPLGVKFLEDSGNDNYLTAVIELVEMYQYGNYVQEDIKKAIFWQKKLADIVLRKSFSSNYGFDPDGYLIQCRRLSILYYESGDKDGVFEIINRYEDLRYSSIIDDTSKIDKEIGYSHYLLGEMYLRENQLEDAGNAYFKAIVELTKAYNGPHNGQEVKQNTCPLTRNRFLWEMDPECAMIAYDLIKAYKGYGNVFELDHKAAAAEKCYKNMVQISEDCGDIREEGVNWELIDIYLNFANFYVKCIELEEPNVEDPQNQAREYLKKAGILIKEFSKYEVDDLEDEDLFAQKIEFYKFHHKFCCGVIYYLIDSKCDAIDAFNLCIEYAKTLNPEHIEVCEDLSEIYFTLGSIEEENKKYSKALKYYEAGIEIIDKIKDHPLSIFRVIRAQLYNKKSIMLAYECQSLQHKYSKELNKKKLEEAARVHEYAMKLSAAEVDEEDMDSYMGIGFRNRLDMLLTLRITTGNRFKHLIVF